MKAAQISEYGDPDVIKINDVNMPVLNSDQVLIEVYSAALNPWDSKVRSGATQSFMPLDLPVTLGGDLAGVVAETGSNVSDFSVGDRVYGEAGVTGGSGAFAEYAAAKAEQLAKLPENVSFQDAAAIALTGVSAVQALQEHMNLQPGQKILIHGGAGGIGSLAIQLAKHIGAQVVTTAAGDDADFVRNLGADEVIDYKTQKFEELVRDCDAVFDTVGGDTFINSFKVLKKGGVLVSMLEKDEDNLAETYGITSVRQFTHATKEKLETLIQLVAEGVVQAHIDRTFPLDQVAEAFRTRETGTIRGKIVLEIKKD